MRQPLLRFLLQLWLGTAVLVDAAVAKTINGFDLKGASVPQREIIQGGPPRDGIPALDDPRFQSIAEAFWLNDDDPVLGLVRNGLAKAYPIAILNWHELVNDQFNDERVLVSYCPLCGTGMAFSSDIEANVAADPETDMDADMDADSIRLDFGVSGLLYNSDVLFYDRQTQSLWSQIDRQAITGHYQGTRLQQLPLELTTWGQWRLRAPDTLVLSKDQGFARDYRDSPYAGYEESKRLFFRVAASIPQDYHTKERVLGIARGDQALALPFVELREQGRAEFEVTFAGAQYRVQWDAARETARLIHLDGTPAVHTIAFWFAWFAFHPATEVFKAPR